MSERINLLVDTAAELFPLRGPIFEMGYWATQNTLALVHQYDGPLRPGTVRHEEGSDTLNSEPTYQPLSCSLGRARTILCHQVLKHVDNPPAGIELMMQNLAPGGIFLMSALSETSSPEKTTHNWHFTPHTIERFLRRFEAAIVGWQGTGQSPHTLFGLACKSPISHEFVDALGPFINKLQQHWKPSTSSNTKKPLYKKWLASLSTEPAGKYPPPENSSLQVMVRMPLSKLFQSKWLQSCLPESKTNSRFNFLS